MAAGGARDRRNRTGANGVVGAALLAAGRGLLISPPLTGSGRAAGSDASAEGFAGVREVEARGGAGARPDSSVAIAPSADATDATHTPRTPGATGPGAAPATGSWPPAPPW